MNLTGGQKAVLSFIQKHIKEKSYPPTVREIGEALSISSTSTVYRYLERLKDKGIIEWEPKVSRTLKVRA